MLHYFHKAGFNSPITLNGSGIIRFEPVGNNAGVKVLDDANEIQKPEIVALNNFADQQIRGITRISAEIYAQKKSNQPSRTSPNRPAPHSGVRVIETEDLSLTSSLKTKSAGLAAGEVQRQLTYDEVQALRNSPIPQQATQNPDGSPGTPIPVTPSEQPRAFIPTVRKVTPAPVVTK